MIGKAELKFTTFELSSTNVLLLTELGSRPGSKILDEFRRVASQ